MRLPAQTLILLLGLLLGLPARAAVSVTGGIRTTNNPFPGAILVSDGTINYWGSPTNVANTNAITSINGSPLTAQFLTLLHSSSPSNFPGLQSVSGSNVVHLPTASTNKTGLLSSNAYLSFLNFADNRSTLKSNSVFYGMPQRPRSVGYHDSFDWPTISSSTWSSRTAYGVPGYTNVNYIVTSTGAGAFNSNGVARLSNDVVNAGLTATYWAITNIYQDSEKFWTRYAVEFIPYHTGSATGQTVIGMVLSDNADPNFWITNGKNTLHAYISPTTGFLDVEYWNSGPVSSLLHVQIWPSGAPWGRLCRWEMQVFTNYVIASVNDKSYTIELSDFPSVVGGFHTNRVFTFELAGSSTNADNVVIDWAESGWVYPEFGQYLVEWKGLPTNILATISGSGSGTVDAITNRYTSKTFTNLAGSRFYDDLTVVKVAGEPEIILQAHGIEGDGSVPRLSLRRSQGDEGTQGGIESADTVGRLEWLGHNAAGSDRVAARMEVKALSDFSGGSQEALFLLNIGDSDTTPQLALSLTGYNATNAVQNWFRSNAIFQAAIKIASGLASNSFLYLDASTNVAAGTFGSGLTWSGGTLTASGGGGAVDAITNRYTSKTFTNLAASRFYDDLTVVKVAGEPEIIVQAHGIEGDGSVPRLSLRRSQGDEGTQAGIEGADTVGRLEWLGHNAAGSDRVAARMEVKALSDFSGGSQEALFLLNIGDSDTTPQLALSLTGYNATNAVQNWFRSNAIFQAAIKIASGLASNSFLYLDASTNVAAGTFGSGLTWSGGTLTASGGGAAALAFTNQLWVQLSGNDATGARNDPDKPYQTLTNAMAASVFGDVINIGFGRWTNFPPGLTVSNGVTLRGLGWQSTVLCFTNDQTTHGPNLKPRDNSTIENLRLEIPQRHGTQVSAPIGVHDSFHLFGFTNVTFRNVRSVGFTDGIIIVMTNACQASFYDSEFDASGDAIVLHGTNSHDLYFKGCRFYEHGPLSPATSVRLLNMSAGLVTYENCILIATNNGTDAYGLNVIGGRAVLRTSFLDVTASAGSIFEVVTAGSGKVEMYGMLKKTNNMAGFVTQSPGFISDIVAGTGITTSRDSGGAVTINSSGGSTTPTGGDGTVQYSSNSLFQSSQLFKYDAVDSSLMLSNATAGKEFLILREPSFSMYIGAREIRATNGALTLSAQLASGVKSVSINSTTGDFRPGENNTQQSGNDDARWLTNWNNAVNATNFTMQNRQGGYVAFTGPTATASTNRFVWSVSSNTVTAGQVLGVHSITASGTENIITITNATDATGGSVTTNYDGMVTFNHTTQTNSESKVSLSYSNLAASVNASNAVIDWDGPTVLRMSPSNGVNITMTGTPPAGMERTIKLHFINTNSPLGSIFLPTNGQDFVTPFLKEPPSTNRIDFVWTGERFYISSFQEETTGSGATVLATNATLTKPIIDDYLEFNEESAPGTPASGKARIYVKTDGKPYVKDDAGTETDLTASGSSPTTTKGDIIFRDTSADNRLALGRAGAALRSGMSIPIWADELDKWAIVDNFKNGASRFGMLVNSANTIGSGGPLYNSDPWFAASGTRSGFFRWAITNHASSTGYMYYAPGTTHTNFLWGTNSMLDATILFEGLAPSEFTNQIFSLGLMGSVSQKPSGSFNGLGVGFLLTGDGTATAATWKTVTRVGGVSTTNTLGIVANTNEWVRLSIQGSTNAAQGGIVFYTNGVAAATHTANIPVGLKMQAGIGLYTSVAAAINFTNYVTVDSFGLFE